MEGGLAMRCFVAYWPPFFLFLFYLQHFVVYTVLIISL